MPDGAQLDAQGGILSWTPTFEQLGPFYVPISVSDDGDPPLSAFGRLIFEVSPPDACVQATCDPATGCASTVLPIAQPCCTGPPSARVAEAVASCPEGRALFIGRNENAGFGRLQDCDRYRVFNQGQVGATIKFHVETRCLNIFRAATINVRLETARRLVTDGPAQQIILNARDDGYAERRSVAIRVRGPGPFFEFEGAEAQMAVTVTDADGISLTEKLRLVLTFGELEDLPDVPQP